MSRIERRRKVGGCPSLLTILNIRQLPLDRFMNDTASSIGELRWELADL